MLSKDAKWGHEMLWAGGAVAKARVVCWDRNAPNSVVALVLSEDGDSEAIYPFQPDGTSSLGHTLRDAPAPKASGTDWIVRGTTNCGTAAAWVRPSREAAQEEAIRMKRCGFTEIAIYSCPWTEGMGVEAEGGE